jgi:hypothetical protein
VFVSCFGPFFGFPLLKSIMLDTVKSPYPGLYWSLLYAIGAKQAMPSETFHERVSEQIPPVIVYPAVLAPLTDIRSPSHPAVGLLSVVL